MIDLEMLSRDGYGDAAAEIKRLLAEIERLRAEALQTEQNWAADWAREYDAIIEKCARVVENYPYAFSYKIAAAIRALKS